MLNGYHLPFAIQTLEDCHLHHDRHYSVDTSPLRRKVSGVQLKRPKREGEFLAGLRTDLSALHHPNSME